MFLVALVETLERLVALEDVLERSAPGGVDGELLVRGDRPVDEGPLRAAAISLAELLEGALLVPAVEDRQLELVRVRLLGEWIEHCFDSTEGE